MQDPFSPDPLHYSSHDEADRETETKQLRSDAQQGRKMSFFAQPPHAVIIGLSGCSGSGKTTLARLLQTVIPGTLILSEDDFYRPEKELPIKKGFPDWDCAEALNVTLLADVVTYVRVTGNLDPSIQQREIVDPKATLTISESTLAAMAAEWAAHSGRARVRVCLVEGFLLYGAGLEPVSEQLDARLFVQARRATALARRAGRTYVCGEGVWVDPPGYPEQVMWENYAQAHKHLFVGADPDAALDQAALANAGITAMPQVDPDVESLLRWAVAVIGDSVDKILT